MFSLVGLRENIGSGRILESIDVIVGMQMLFRVRGRCDGSEEPRAYSSVY